MRAGDGGAVSVRVRLSVSVSVSTIRTGSVLRRGQRLVSWRELGVGLGSY